MCIFEEGGITSNIDMKILVTNFSYTANTASTINFVIENPDET